VPLPRFSRLDAEERQRILVGAATEFGEGGYARASLNRIIKSVGLSKGAMYYYFDGKEDLYRSVIDYAVALLVARQGEFEVESVTAERYWPQLDEFTQNNLRVLCAHSWVGGVARAVLCDRVDAPGRHLRELFQHWIERYLARGQQLGLVRDDLPIELLVGAVVSTGEAVDRWMLKCWEAEPERVDSLSPLLLDLLKRLIEPNPKAGK
jgi:AcrR family transcriptional regulator